MKTILKKIILLSSYGILLSPCIAQDFQQSYSPQNKTYKFSDIVSIQLSSQTSSQAGASYVVSNFFQDEVFQESGIFIQKLDAKAQITESLALTIENKKLLGLASVLDGTDLYLFCSAIHVDFGPSTIHLVKFNLNLKKLVWCKSLAARTSTSLGDLLIHDNKISLLYDEDGYAQVIQFDKNGNLISRNTITTSDSAQAIHFSNIIVSSNNQLVLAGYKGMESELNKLILLTAFSTDGTILFSKNMKFFDATKTTQFRFGRIFLGTNGSNLHVATQAIVGRSDAGPILITMLDSNLVLRTWRNYSHELILEDLSVSNVNFILSGQRPVTNGLLGYALVRINALNAIPEKATELTWEKFHNFSIASNSVSTFQSATRNLLLAALPSNSIDNIITTASQHFQTIGTCEKSFNFNVTKDPVEMTDDLSIKTVIDTPSVSENEVQVETIQMDLLGQCATTDVHSDVKQKFSIHSNSNELRISSNYPSKNVKIQISTVDGKVLLQKEADSSKELIIGIEEYVSGFYILSLKAENNTVSKYKFWK